MAPFKLKFRMGSARSSSQEHDSDPQVNEALLNHHHQQHHHNQSTAASSSTIDSTDCNSLGSMGNSSERKSLLPNSSKSNSLRLGYLNQNISQCISESSTDGDTVPTTPPPSYEHVLEEKNRYSHNFERQLSLESNNSQRSSINNSRNNINLNVALDQLSLATTCNDPDCEQNQNYLEQNCNNNLELEQEQGHSNVVELVQQQNNGGDCDYDGNDCDADNCDGGGDDNVENSDLNMSAPNSRENLLECTDENCDGACGDCESELKADGFQVAGASCSNNSNHSYGACNSRQSFYDPLLNHHEYYNEVAHYNENEHQQQQQQHQHQHQQHQQQQQQQQHQASTDYMHETQMEQGNYNRPQREELDCSNAVLQAELMSSNKSSKELYKDLAKQWGITCKMSDGCRCMDCQSNYFDCEYEDNEHSKTDGGLGAGTPMFISEVMHGSACNIL